MLLDDQELHLLARFFAKRFPHAPDRAPILDRAGLEDAPGTPRQAWRAILEQAQAHGALDTLAGALRSDDPDDVNLREVRRLLAGGRSTPAPTLAVVLALAAGAVLVVGTGAVATARALSADDDVIEPERVTLATRTEAPVPDSTFVPPEEAPPPTPNLSADHPPIPDERRHAPPTAVGASDVRCTDLPWLEGYWYAGSEPPGQPGDVIVLSRAVNVRTQVPSWRNGWDAGSPVQCVLLKGDIVRIGNAPIPVPVDRYWVAIEAEDLIADSG